MAACDPKQTWNQNRSADPVVSFLMLRWNSSLSSNLPAISLSRARRAMSSALPQELRFMMEVISTEAVPSSFMRPSRT